MYMKTGKRPNRLMMSHELYRDRLNGLIVYLAPERQAKRVKYVD
jgi:hypothetical protein